MSVCSETQMPAVKYAVFVFTEKGSIRPMEPDTEMWIWGGFGACGWQHGVWVVVHSCCTAVAAAGSAPGCARCSRVSRGLAHSHCCSDLIQGKSWLLQFWLISWNDSSVIRWDPPRKDGFELHSSFSSFKCVKIIRACLIPINILREKKKKETLL